MRSIIKMTNGVYRPSARELSLLIMSLMLLLQSLLVANAFQVSTIHNKNHNNKQHNHHHHNIVSRGSLLLSAAATASSTNTVAASGEDTIAHQLMNAFNAKDLNAVMKCFDDDDNCSYQDTLFERAAKTKKEVQERFQQAMKDDDDDTTSSTRGKDKIVIDTVAVCPITGNVGAAWHLEEASTGKILPFSKGCSFYTTNLETGRIKTGFRVMEIPFKPSNARFNLLTLPKKMKETFDVTTTTTTTTTTAAADKSNDDNNDKGVSGKSKEQGKQQTEFSSIVEEAYHKWNIRDMDGAVECFSDDIYLDDTLYCDPIQGKEALRKHYYAVIEAQVPLDCKKIIDDIAIDPTNGNIAVLWHLEVVDVGKSNVPSLLEGWSRGCSMYTTKPDSGLIATGLDVTEPPLKKMTDTGLWSSRHFNF